MGGKDKTLTAMSPKNETTTSGNTEYYYRPSCNKRCMCQETRVILMRDLRFPRHGNSTVFWDMTWCSDVSYQSFGGGGGMVPPSSGKNRSSVHHWRWLSAYTYFFPTNLPAYSWSSFWPFINESQVSYELAK